MHFPSQLQVENVRGQCSVLAPAFDTCLIGMPWWAGVPGPPILLSEIKERTGREQPCMDGCPLMAQTLFRALHGTDAH